MVFVNCRVVILIWPVCSSASGCNIGDSNPHMLTNQPANVNSPHSVQMCATATFKRGYKENQWDYVDVKTGGVN